MMFLQRTIFICVIVLCCFRFCLCTNCAYFPYHPACRGTMKRTLNPSEFSDIYPPQFRYLYGNSHNGCFSSDCKAKIKYLFTLLKDNTDHQSQIANRQEVNPYDDYEAPARKGLRSEQRSRNNLFEKRNMMQDYID